MFARARRKRALAEVLVVHNAKPWTSARSSFLLLASRASQRQRMVVESHESGSR